MMKRLYIFSILIFLLAQSGIAQQESYNWRLGLYSGGMGYYGDLNTRIINPQTQWLADPTTHTRPAFGLSLEHNVTGKFGIKALWSNGRFTANDRQVSFSNSLQTDAENFARSLNARTFINDFSLIGSLYLERNRTFAKKIQFSPYLMLGAGVTMFEVYGDLFLDNGDRYYYWNDFSVYNTPQNSGILSDPILQDGNYETNLTKLKTEDTEYNTTVANIPFGLGLKFRLGDRLNLNLETLWHYTFTDYLDDVSGVYPSTFTEPSPEQAYATNPAGTQAVWRGREDDRFNDIYTFNTLSLQYSFGYRKGSVRPPVEFADAGDSGKTFYETKTIVLNEQGDTLRIEQRFREDDPVETARLKELDEEKALLEEEMAMLEKEIGVESEAQSPEVVVEVETEKPRRRDRKRNKRDNTETELPIKEPEAPEVEIETELPIKEPEAPVVEIETEMPEEPEEPAITIEVETSEPDDPDVAVAIEEPKRKRRDRRKNKGSEDIEIVIESPETPEVEIVVEPEVAVNEGDRPTRPAKPDISLGEGPEVEIVVEPEMSGEDLAVEIDLPDSEEGVVEEPKNKRKERKRKNKEAGIPEVTISEPEVPEVEIFVGDKEVEMPEEITIEQPETPTVEIEIETPEKPTIEVEVETSEMPTVEIETPEEPTIEVEVETPETPTVEIETPEEPTIEVEVEIPEAPTVEIEVETEQPEVVVEKPSRRDRKRDRRNKGIEEVVTIGDEESAIPEAKTELPEMPNVEVETPEAPVVEIEVETETPTVKVEVETPTIKPPSAETGRETELNPNITSIVDVNFASAQGALDAYSGFYIPFEDEAYYVAKEVYDELDKLVATLHRYRSFKATLQGHTAEVAAVSHFHQEITRRRVHYIQNYLVTKGIDLDRIELNFFDKPANLTDINKQRVHVIMSR